MLIYLRRLRDRDEIEESKGHLGK